MSAHRPIATVAALALASLALLAQDSSPTNARDLQPRASEMAPLAARTLLLALTRAGESLVAAGDRGIILVSGDGQQWQQVPSPVHATLTSVSFADDRHGWIGGHDSAILRTTDGGRSWQLQNFDPHQNKPVLSLLALDAQRAWAVGAYGLFLATADGGTTWTPVEAPALLEDGLHLNSVVRLANGEFFIVGETGLAAISADGSDWKRLQVPYEGSLFGALPRGERGALIYGLRGNVYVSDDVRGGAWQRIDTQTVQSMFGGARLPDGGAVLVGADGEILVIDAAGQIRKARGPQDARSLGSGTLSGVVPVNGHLLVVGELGVTRMELPER